MTMTQVVNERVPLVLRQKDVYNTPGVFSLDAGEKETVVWPVI
jgi:hypothetical protein